MSNNHKNDPFGLAVEAYYKNADNTPIVVASSIAEDEELFPEYLFREFDSMPKLEKEALKYVRASVLDLGAGAGCHSLYLQDQGFDVTALELSPLCCEVMKSRQIERIINGDFMTLTLPKFDTLLLLMNGAGLAGKYENLSAFVTRLKALLNPKGRVLIDSADMMYMYKDDETEETWINLNADEYYGEVEYKLSYKDGAKATFPWTFFDPDTLIVGFEEKGFRLIDFFEGDYHNYLCVFDLLG
ncbi:MAG: class I SAM-dependent methyltransferase [Bacteroidales bacterium]